MARHSKNSYGAESLDRTGSSDRSSATSGAQSKSASRASHRRDHRAALQANKLRMGLATKAVCFGIEEPVVPPKQLRILVVSLVIACILLVVTIGAAKVLQML